MSNKCLLVIGLLLMRTFFTCIEKLQEQDKEIPILQNTDYLIAMQFFCKQICKLTTIPCKLKISQNGFPIRRGGSQWLLQYQVGTLMEEMLVLLQSTLRVFLLSLHSFHYNNLSEVTKYSLAN